MSARKIIPPTYFWIMLLLLIGSHFGFPIRKIIIPPYSYFGSMFIIIGIVLNIWSDGLFKKKGTTVQPYELPLHLISHWPIPNQSAPHVPRYGINIARFCILVRFPYGFCVSSCIHHFNGNNFYPN